MENSQTTDSTKGKLKAKPKGILKDKPTKFSFGLNLQKQPTRKNNLF